MQTVAVIVQEGAEPFGLGSLVEVWGESYHPEDQNPVFDFRVCTPRPGRVRGRSDFDLHVERGLEATLDADLVCLAPKHDFMDYDVAVQEAIVAADQRGAILYAHCSGVFELGAAGLLEQLGHLVARQHVRQPARLLGRTQVRRRVDIEDALAP